MRDRREVGTRMRVGSSRGGVVVEQRELRVTQMTWEAESVLSIRLSRIEGKDPLPESLDE